MVLEQLLLRQFKKDLEEALNLLMVAGPNPLLIDFDEYWDRHKKLTDKYISEDQDEN